MRFGFKDTHWLLPPITKCYNKRYKIEKQINHKFAKPSFREQEGFELFGHSGLAVFVEERLDKPIDRLDRLLALLAPVAVDRLEVRLVDPLAAFEAKGPGDRLRPDVGGQGKPGDDLGRFLHQPFGVGLDGVDGLFVGEGLVFADALEEALPFVPGLGLAPVVLVAAVGFLELDGGGKAADDMLGLGPILQRRDEEGDLGFGVLVVIANLEANPAFDVHDEASNCSFGGFVVDTELHRIPGAERRAVAPKLGVEDGSIPRKRFRGSVEEVHVRFVRDFKPSHFRRVFAVLNLGLDQVRRDGPREVIRRKVDPGANAAQAPGLSQKIEPALADDGVPSFFLAFRLAFEVATLFVIAASLTLQFKNGGGLPEGVVRDRSAIPERQSRSEFQFDGVAVNARELGRLGEIHLQDLEQIFEEARLALIRMIEAELQVIDARVERQLPMGGVTAPPSRGPFGRLVILSVRALALRAAKIFLAAFRRGFLG